MSIKKFQKQKIMKELLKAFPTMHTERQLTSLEKGRMTVKMLDELDMPNVISKQPFIKLTRT